MPHIQELMAAGAPWRLAKMLGQHRISTVWAEGSSAADAVELATNFCLVATTAPGQGVALDFATDAALTALYNSGPDAVLVYPAPEDAFNDQVPDAPVLLSAGQTLLAVPAVRTWLTAIGGGLGDAPANGAVYARQNGVWVAVPPPGTPPPAAIVTDAAGGNFPVPAGTGRVWVNCSAPVTIILPFNDCLVADRSGNAATAPIMVTPPTAGITINGLTAYGLVNPWAIAQFVWDGTNFAV
ncbi:MAG TPA: hypothetical protein VGF07_13155 [Stellaceae bacterium]|jgi:hypothetical protein